MWLQFCKALVTRHVLLHHLIFVSFRLFILVFRIPAILDHQLVGMLQGRVRCAYRKNNFELAWLQIVCMHPESKTLWYNLNRTEIGDVFKNH